MDSNNGHCACVHSLDHHETKQNGDRSSSFAPNPKKPKLTAPQVAEAQESEASLVQAEFAHHESGVARINNGSFGSCPNFVLKAQCEWQKIYLQHPDRFYFGPLQQGILQSRKVIAELVNASSIEEISIVDNATTAVAIVLQKTAWAFMEGKYNRGDAVVMLHYAYGAVKTAIQAYVKRAGGSIIEVELPFPVSSDKEIVDSFRKALAEGKSGGRRVRLAVIDHITSMPSVLIPVKELTRICREEGVDQVFVDAAHAIGSIDIDLQSIGADFYTSNLHKWFFCPPAVAFLYCKKLSQSDMHHPIVSHEYGNGLAIESAWIGTRDYSSQLVVPSVLEFVKKFEGGLEGIMKRNHDNVVLMGKMLADAWGTKLGTTPEMCSSMIMIGLPACLKVLSEMDALNLRTHLRENYGVEVPVYYKQPRDGVEEECAVGYVRISHQIYNVVEDYYKLRDAIKQLVADSFDCGKLGAA
ncbi:hypothetical protein AMTRI_Chr02g266160 [Amborella trichopoda]|uniref:Aminotransferase class V domain-containing protein n=1 Tax=Amborella trichopoda TaxID=13333 RepID=W1P286_AMBTC|nr:L-cysteine desulfhydrase [Amborella trichopoda]ERN02033.1 hypothetical protein AMTR_s00045p00116700 [Amborella trichopoda]|eukprot:XP_006840358.1 L-cysteine desulfhydrase [Amborella trichopoda]